MKNKSNLSTTLALSTLAVIQPISLLAMVKTGAPAGNFPVGGEVSPRGRILPNVVYNPPALGGGLEDKPGGSFSFTEGNTTRQDSNFKNQKINRLFPPPDLEFSDARMAGLAFKCLVVAPIKAQDRPVTSLPVFLARFEVVNRRPTAATVKFDFSGGGQFVNQTGTIMIPAHATGTSRFFWVVTYDATAYYANEFHDENALATHGRDHFDELESFTRQFSDSLPHTGYADVDEYMRWHMKTGRVADGLQVIRTMAKADLEWTGEHNPHEYPGGSDGRGHRYFQGWDTDLFGVPYFGLKGPKPPSSAPASSVTQARSSG